jgi:hypothetical protein
MSQLDNGGEEEEGDEDEEGERINWSEVVGELISKTTALRP